MNNIDLDDLYKKHFKEIYLFLIGISSSKEVAEEITQETFFKVIKSINTFDGSNDIRAWIFAIARNTYYSYYKKNKKIVNESMEYIMDNKADLLSQYMNKDTAFIIHKILHNMDEPYKEVFSLRVFGELPFEKIGILFNKNASWARVTFYRAKKKIMETMEEFNE